MNNKYISWGIALIILASLANFVTAQGGSTQIGASVTVKAAPVNTTANTITIKQTQGGGWLNSFITWFDTKVL